MKVYNFRGLVLAFIGVFLCFGFNVSAQQSGSSSSVARSRAISQSNPAPTNSTHYNTAVFTPPDEVAVEEFVNYHKHRLPLPKAGQAAALDVRWGNNEISRFQREAVLQIGLTTAEVSERTDLRPLNLALVIDKSGSMLDGDKMSRVKESLRTMVGKLRPNDIVSIVVFDNDAQVLFQANRVGNSYELRRAIDCIAPEGSTNLHAGLMLGYREAKKNFRKDATNRVILLTDGIANVGTIDPKRIAAESSELNGQGIDLSTIGVGLELNNDLLRRLAKSGRGLYHFISDNQDIEKVFVNEVQSLISSVGRNVELSVEADANLQIEKIYGYAPRLRTNGVSIGLDDMNNGLTQVVMMSFRVKDATKNSNPVKVRLSYFDIKRGRTVEEVQEIALTSTKQESCELLADVEVKKNYTIALLAQSLFEMTETAKRGKHLEAENLVNQSVSDAYRRYPNMEDKDISFVLNIVENYRGNLRSYNQQTRNKDCGNCR